jgi:hypothetical protein
LLDLADGFWLGLDDFLLGLADDLWLGFKDGFWLSLADGLTCLGR